MQGDAQATGTATDGVGIFLQRRVVEVTVLDEISLGGFEFLQALVQVLLSGIEIVGDFR